MKESGTTRSVLTAEKGFTLEWIKTLNTTVWGHTRPLTKVSGAK